MSLSPGGTVGGGRARLAGARRGRGRPCPPGAGQTAAAPGRSPGGWEHRGSEHGVPRPWLSPPNIEPGLPGAGLPPGPRAAPAPTRPHLRPCPPPLPHPGDRDQRPGPFPDSEGAIGSAEGKTGWPRPHCLTARLGAGGQRLPHRTEVLASFGWGGGAGGRIGGLRGPCTLRVGAGQRWGASCLEPVVALPTGSLRSGRVDASPGAHGHWQRARRPQSGCWGLAQGPGGGLWLAGFIFLSTKTESGSGVSGGLGLGQ